MEPIIYMQRVVSEDFSVGNQRTYQIGANRGYVLKQKTTALGIAVSGLLRCMSLMESSTCIILPNGKFTNRKN